ncbi:hypothetical protein PHSY_000729 [Pseudozyma hubeiensis SY62]|uniref:Uncharacterized protein n=1 Tax=Pseudozyma hubeiensis (strain SY62) TaxID=1305764 RepID=R9NX77_PSEHS|nr:hypothetical protein PHSY_000729 [Pseudozyma hubeiensis SY62]GAC93166.1 hypothetical protein PHSY_000729 [Pseudozyma hubeiensis SY62]
MSSNESEPLVALIGTLDTKKEEYQFATTWLEAHGCKVVVLDASTKSPLDSPSSFNLGARSGLYRPKELLKSHSDESDTVIPTERSALRDALREACLGKLARLHAEGALDAIASFGGSQNTAFATSIMRDAAFPIGLPKFMLTTMASGDVSEYLGESDICIMPSIGDISGSLNTITLTTLQSALAAISGMAHACHASKKQQESAVSSIDQHNNKPMIAISMFGVTTEAVNQISELLKQRGYEPVAFHATGSGGRSMERLIRESYFAAVIDLTTTEICDHLYGGVLSAGPDRLSAATEKEVPQIVSVGALDMINFGSLSSLPARCELEDGEGPLHHTTDGTPVYEHNSQVTLVRTSVEQNKELGRYLVEKISQNKKGALARVLFPRTGISAMDGKDGVWDDPEARNALLDSIQATVKQRNESREGQSGISLEVIDHHINSREFAEIVATRAIELIETAEDAQPS